MATRLEIEHLVCPEPSCQHVGKVHFTGGLKGFCTGSPSKGTAHKKRRMKWVTFSAKAPEVEKASA